MKGNIQNKSAEERLEDCMNLTDLYDAFTLRELMTLTKDGVLTKWCKNHLFESQAEILSSVGNLSDDIVLMTLCNTLNIDVTKLSDYEAGLVIRAVRRERDKNKRERECGKDGKIATDQSELVEALIDESVRKVYLYDNIFSIPLNRSNITYDGRGNAVINIFAPADQFLDFDGNQIYFYNLTIVFHYLDPGHVKIEHSGQNHNRIIFLYGNRLIQDDSVKSNEISALIAGRTPFESANDFADRADKFQGVIVGETYLNANDYDLWHEAFFLRPIWRVNFIECLRHYAQGARLLFNIPCEEAKDLFERERAQLIYADFGTDMDDAVIVRLYLHTDNGKGKIYPIYRLWPSSSWAFTADSGGAGYGLELIATDHVNRKSYEA